MWILGLKGLSRQLYFQLISVLEFFFFFHIIIWTHFSHLKGATHVSIYSSTCTYSSMQYHINFLETQLCLGVASILKVIFLPWKNQKGFILLVDLPF